MRLDARQRNAAGFTLVELLAVMIIIGIMVGIGVSVFANSGKGLLTKKAASEITGSLASARQLAIASNSRTRFVLMTDSSATSGFKSYAVFSEKFVPAGTGDGNFVFQPATPFTDLPVGVYCEHDVNSTGTSGVTETQADADAIICRGTRTTAYRMIEFLPSGNTSTSGVNNVLVIGKGAKPGTLFDSKVDPDKWTMVVGASTGKIKVLQLDVDYGQATPPQ